MKVNISFTRQIAYLILLILTINSFPQTVEKNGVMYRDFQFNDDNVKNNLLIKSDEESILADTVRLPFIKNDFIVNTFDGEYGADQRKVCGAIDGSGNYAFTWIDYRNSEGQIFAQFFNSNDQRIGANFSVNEDPLIGNNDPSIDANNDGDFVIVWLRNFQDVMAQKFTKEGQKVGTNIFVNTNSGWNTSQPSVSVNSDGSFMVIWASEPGNWQYTVYARLFDPSGNSIGQDILVSDASLGSSSIGRGRTIDSDGLGNYYLTWSSGSSSNLSKIYLQQLNSNGNKIGNNILVSNPNDSSQNYFPDIASTDDGHVLITWERDFSYPYGGGVGGRIYHSNGYFVTDEFTVSYNPNSAWHPVNLSTDRDSTFLVIWYDNGPQYFQKIKSNGEFLGDTVRVKYNSMRSGYNFQSGMTDIFDNHFYVAPEFNERRDDNIYLQKFNSALQPIGAFSKLHDDFGSAEQKKSFTKFNNRGESIILWEDQRNGRFDLYAQLYDTEFNPIGNNIQINDTNDDHFFLENKNVHYLSDGSFVIAFCGGESYSYSQDVFLQIVSNTGEKQGQNKLVKEGNYYDYKISLNVNMNDEILISWYNTYGADFRIYDKNLNPLSGERNILTSSVTIGFQPIAVSIDSLFNILVIWNNYYSESGASDNKIRGKFADQNGNSSASAFVTDSVNSYVKDYYCKNQGQNFAFLYRDGSKIYLKRRYNLDKSYSFENSFYSYGYEPDNINIVEFDNQKTFVTFNSYLDVFGFYANDNKRKTETYLLHHYEYIDPYYENYNGINSADIFNEKLIFTYENNSNSETGYDIFANVRKIENVNFESELFYPPANYDVLYNNYPNPFNSRTKIAYELLSFHNVKLTVYDILGSEVKVLVNENQEKGLYEVDFDATGLASGIYFYKLDAFNTTVKKMILLK